MDPNLACMHEHVQFILWHVSLWAMHLMEPAGAPARVAAPHVHASGEWH